MSDASDALILRAAWVQEDWRHPRQRAEALAVVGGRVAAIGSLAEAWRAVGSDAPTLDLGDACIAPGFHDAHLHLAKLALQARILDIDPTWSQETVLEAVRKVAAQQPAGWIVGRGWDHSGWGAWPDASDLERVAPGRAVCLTRKDGHAVWLSPEGLRRAALDEHRNDPEGGRLLRRGDGGLSGILLEQAIELAYDVLPAPGPSERRESLMAVWPRLWALGVTAVTDMGFRGLDLWDDLSALEEAEALGLRCALYVMEDGFDEAIARGLARRGAGPWLNAAGLKLFLDGTLGSRTAWMLEPYSDRAGHGIATLGSDAAAAAIAKAAAAGWPTAAHAIGDAAVRLALDLFEAEPSAPDGRHLRHRVEHLQRVAPEDLPRFGQAQRWASVQPIHLAADWAEADQAWGQDRCRQGAYPWRSVLTAGGRLALGSDAPIEPPAVLPGLRLATSRRDGAGRPADGWQAHEAISLAEALTGYTWGGAAAAGWDAWLGSLSPGKAADFVVMGGLARDVVGLPLAEALGGWQVLSTWLGGRCAWQSDGWTQIVGDRVQRQAPPHG